MAQLLTTFGSRADILGNMAENAPSRDSVINMAEVARRLPSAEAMAEEFGLNGIDPASLLAAFPEQRAAFDQIVAQQSGLMLLTGGPGSGKVGFITGMPQLQHCYHYRITLA